MAKIGKPVDIELIVRMYEIDNRSIRYICKNVGLKDKLVAKIIEESGSERLKRNRERYVSKNGTWNKGKTKHDDERIALGSSKLSVVKRKTFIRCGYPMVYSEFHKKAIKEHDYIWFLNNGKLPDRDKKEQVHHIDGDKNNNSIGNLLLVNVTEHSRIHKEYERIGEFLLKEGVIDFSIEKRGVDWESVQKLVNKLKALG